MKISACPCEICSFLSVSIMTIGELCKFHCLHILFGIKGIYDYAFGEFFPPLHNLKKNY